MHLEDHYRRLEKMYAAAPINTIFQPDMRVGQGTAEIEISVSSRLFHTAGAVHGSVYFKMLDDAAFFAANSLEPDVFVLTVSFTLYMTRPVSEGRLRSVGRVVNRTRTQFIAESVLYDSRGREVGRGNGIFVRSKIALMGIDSYSAPLDTQA